MPLPNAAGSDLQSTAMPGELGHVHALGTQNCKQVTVPSNSSVILPAGSTHALCSCPHKSLTSSHCTQKGLKVLSLFIAEGLLTPQKMRTGSFLLGPHAYKYLFSVIKSRKHFSVCVWASVKKNQKLATRGDQVCLHAPVHQVCQNCTFFSVILPPAVTCTQAWKYWGQHSTPQDGTGSKWPGFPPILHCLQPNRAEWEPRRKIQQVVTVTICTPYFSQCFMLPVFYEIRGQNEQ